MTFACQTCYHHQFSDEGQQTEYNWYRWFCCSLCLHVIFPFMTDRTSRQSQQITTSKEQCECELHVTKRRAPADRSLNYQCTEGTSISKHISESFHCFQIVRHALLSTGHSPTTRYFALSLFQPQQRERVKVLWGPATEITSSLFTFVCIWACVKRHFLSLSTALVLLSSLVSYDPCTYQTASKTNKEIMMCTRSPWRFYGSMEICASIVPEKHEIYSKASRPERQLTFYKWCCQQTIFIFFVVLTVLFYITTGSLFSQLSSWHNVLWAPANNDQMMQCMCRVWLRDGRTFPPCTKRTCTEC